MARKTEKLNVLYGIIEKVFHLEGQSYVAVSSCRISPYLWSA